MAFALDQISQAELNSIAVIKQIQLDIFWGWVRGYNVTVPTVHEALGLIGPLTDSAFPAKLGLIVPSVHPCLVAPCQRVNDGLTHLNHHSKLQA